MHHNPSPADEEQWVIWNGGSGILATATIGHVELGERGRRAWMARPFDMLGPFDLDELEACGRITFAACMVMSRLRWQEDQAALREDAHARRRAAQAQWAQAQARFGDGRRRRGSFGRPIDERQHRETLNLPAEGKLEPAQIKQAFRRLAQKVHPDVGGSQEQFVRITEARNALLAPYA
jgi:hypothetical protein